MNSILNSLKIILSSYILANCRKYRQQFLVMKTSSYVYTLTVSYYAKISYIFAEMWLERATVKLDSNSMYPYLTYVLLSFELKQSITYWIVLASSKFGKIIDIKQAELLAKSVYLLHMSTKLSIQSYCSSAQASSSRIFYNQLQKISRLKKLITISLVFFSLSFFKSGLHKLKILKQTVCFSSSIFVQSATSSSLEI